MNLGRLLSNKPLLFGGSGAVAGILATFLSSEIYRTLSLFGLFSQTRTRSFAEQLANTFLQDLLSFGVFGAVCVPVLLWANGLYQRRPMLDRKTFARALAFGAGGALLSTFAVEVFFQVAVFLLPKKAFVAYILRAGAWGVIGAAVGVSLALLVPNHKWTRGLLGGVLGGLLGGLLMSYALGAGANFLGGWVSFALTGCILGLSIVVVEKLLREAGAEVIWAPNETTAFNLGARPITIGSGEDHIPIVGLPARFAGLTFTEGKVEYVEFAKEARTLLRHGSRLKFGKVEVLIHAYG